MPHNQPTVPVMAADGHAFELIHVAPAQPVSSLLFLPGMGMTARQYIGLARALSDRGVEVFIHEWRGLGSSGLRADRQANWGYRELLMLDLAAALEQAADHAAMSRLVFAGHSLGSQLACLLAGQHPERCGGIAVIAGGAPNWRSFPLWMGLPLYSAFHLMPTVAQAVGHYPGRRLGFAGREARGVMADWARTGRSGIYAAPGIDNDLEQAMAELQLPVLGIRFADDWFVPPQSLDFLLVKLSRCVVSKVVISATEIGSRADHYAWMQYPEATANTILQWQDQSLSAESDKTAATRRA